MIEQVFQLAQAGSLCHIIRDAQLAILHGVQLEELKLVKAGGVIGVQQAQGGPGQIGKQLLGCDCLHSRDCQQGVQPGRDGSVLVVMDEIQRICIHLVKGILEQVKDQLVFGVVEIDGIQAGEACLLESAVQGVQNFWLAQEECQDMFLELETGVRGGEMGDACPG